MSSSPTNSHDPNKHRKKPSYFKTLPEAIVSKPDGVPRISNSRFPTLDPTKKIKTVYELAGFDVYKPNKQQRSISQSNTPTSTRFFSENNTSPQESAFVRYGQRSASTTHINQQQQQQQSQIDSLPPFVNPQQRSFSAQHSSPNHSEPNSPSSASFNRGFNQSSNNALGLRIDAQMANKQPKGFLVSPVASSSSTNSFQTAPIDDVGGRSNPEQNGKIVIVDNKIKPPTDVLDSTIINSEHETLGSNSINVKESLNEVISEKKDKPTQSQEASTSIKSSSLREDESIVQIFRNNDTTDEDIADRSETNHQKAIRGKSHLSTGANTTTTSDEFDFESMPSSRITSVSPQDTPYQNYYQTSSVTVGPKLGLLDVDNGGFRDSRGSEYSQQFSPVRNSTILSPMLESINGSSPNQKFVDQDEYQTLEQGLEVIDDSDSDINTDFENEVEREISQNLFKEVETQLNGLSPTRKQPETSINKLESMLDSLKIKEPLSHQQAPPIVTPILQITPEFNDITHKPDSFLTPQIANDTSSTKQILNIQHHTLKQANTTTSNHQMAKSVESIQPTILPGSPSIQSTHSTITSAAESSHRTQQSIFKHPPGQGPCRTCGLAITLKPIYSKSGELSGQWHRSCFHCTMEFCQKLFTRQTPCFVLDDSPYCEQHYHEVNNSFCKICNVGIIGECMEDDFGARYHIDCLKCCRCEEKILSGGYVCIDEKVYCENCAVEIQRLIALNEGLSAETKLERRRTRLFFV